jgi:hypothetical protein
VGWSRGEWLNAMQATWQEKQILLTCPNAMDRRKTSNNGGFEQYGGVRSAYVMGAGTATDNEVCSYGLNNWVYYATNDIQGRKKEWHWGTLEAAPDPSSVPLMADSRWRGGGPWYGEFAAYTPSAKPDDYSSGGNFASFEMQHFALPRHEKAINVLALDGSALRTRLRDLWSLKWHREWDTGAWQRFVQFPAWL